MYYLLLTTLGWHLPCDCGGPLSLSCGDWPSAVHFLTAGLFQGCRLLLTSPLLTRVGLVFRPCPYPWLRLGTQNPEPPPAESIEVTCLQLPAALGRHGVIPQVCWFSSSVFISSSFLTQHLALFELYVIFFPRKTKYFSETAWHLELPQEVVFPTPA